VTRHVEKYSRLRPRLSDLKKPALEIDRRHVIDEFADHIPAPFPECLITLARWLTDLKNVRESLTALARARESVRGALIDERSDVAARAVSVWHEVGILLLSIKDAAVDLTTRQPRGWVRCLTATELAALVSFGRDLCGIGRPADWAFGPQHDRHPLQFPDPFRDRFDAVRALEDRLYKHVQLIDLQSRISPRDETARHDGGILVPPPSLPDAPSRVTANVGCRNIVVDVDRLEIRIDSVSHPIENETAARYVRVLVERAGSWISSVDLPRWDSELQVGEDVTRLRRNLPKPVREAITGKRGKGTMLSLEKL